MLPSLGGLIRRTEEPVRGPSPSFDRVHLLFTFLAIGGERTVGRQALARQAGLGEGAMRTILKKLREEGYADADASGCHLTHAGKRVYESTKKKLSLVVSVEGSQLSMGDFQAAVAVRGGAKGVRSGIEQRDSAIKIGATGATTYVIRAGRFAVSGGSSDCEKDFPSQAWSSLRKELKPRNGDSIILSGSDDPTSARLGALAAALTLL